jgi:threonine aldolase
MNENAINLMNDYNTPAHPAILAAIEAAAGNKYVGYGTDDACTRAGAAVRKLLGNEAVDVHFMVGGTQTNLTAISAFLRPHEAVIAPATAHINVHETGAIEAVGHKILSFGSPDGKARPENIEEILEFHVDEHMVKPRLLFISLSTEYGSVYTRAELAALKACCVENDLLFYIDGARLGYALASEVCDLEPTDIARFADAFYLGGTKNGLLFGEALVICNPLLREDFRFIIKQRGGLIAKGFLLGIQFDALLADGLYFKLAAEANRMAALLRDGLTELGCDFEVEPQTNQLFPIVDAKTAEALSENVLFEVWHSLPGGMTSIRFITTWATTEQEIRDVLKLLNKLI